MCHYYKNMWSQFEHFVSPLAPLSLDDCPELVVAIPKFHLAGHTDGCFAQYSLNFVPGVSQLDAEGGKQCWSNLNNAAGGTSENGPGSCIDGINQVMQQWNLSKMFGM
ncbi:hypothetical protein FRC11_003617, partial [Ceratobasidium sp. 423]